jgi:hypothetical protein
MAPRPNLRLNGERGEIRRNSLAIRFVRDNFMPLDSENARLAQW